MGVCSDDIDSVDLEGFVCGGIERILQMLAKLRILHIIWIRQQGSPFTLWVVGFHLTQAVVGHIHPALSRVEQIKVIPGFVEMFIILIVVCQSAQEFLAQSQVVHLILQDDTCLEQRLLDDLMAGCLLLIGKGYLCQIELAIVRIGSCLDSCGVDRSLIA